MMAGQMHGLEDGKQERLGNGLDSESGYAAENIHAIRRREATQRLLQKRQREIEVKVACAVSRVIKGIKDDRVMRWGELDSNQLKVLQVKVSQWLFCGM